MYKEILIVIFGVIGLAIGSGIVVESSKRLAKHLKISRMLIGLSIVSIGTSLPEISTNIVSGINVAGGVTAASGIAVGTVIGSCLSQITLIFGISGMFGRIKSKKRFLKRDGSMALFAIITMFLVGITGQTITMFEGIVLMLIYFGYLYYLAKSEKIGDKIYNSLNHEKASSSFDLILLIAVGLFILIFSTKFVVENALGLAKSLGVASSFIGVMIVGLGSGLPELSTAIRGLKEKAGDLTVGTLIGSNITDPLLSLSAGAISSGKSGLFFNQNLLFFDVPFWFASTILLLYLFWKNNSINKKQALILLSVYFLFVILKIIFFR